MLTSIPRVQVDLQPIGGCLPALASFVIGLIRTAPAALMVLLGSAGIAGAQQVQAVSTFTLQEFLGKTWRNEAVRFTASAAQLANARAGHVLVGPDNKPVLYQLLLPAPGAQTQIEFAADLNPFETRDYHFAEAAAASPQTDIIISESPDGIRVTNGKIGILIRKRLVAGQGPIAGVRLNSGDWIGTLNYSLQQLFLTIARM